jgi:hypothetical protein
LLGFFFLKHNIQITRAPANFNSFQGGSSSNHHYHFDAGQNRYIAMLGLGVGMVTAGGAVLGGYSSYQTMLDNRKANKILIESTSAQLDTLTKRLEALENTKKKD